MELSVGSSYIYIEDVRYKMEVMAVEVTSTAGPKTMVSLVNNFNN